jgi:putative membrane protein
LAVRWLILAVAVWVAAELVAGIHYSGWASILVVAAILGLLNLYVRPLFALLTLPLTIVTLGIFIIVVNAIMLGLAAWISDIFGAEFSVDGIGAALLGALIISLVSMTINHFVDVDRITGDWTGGRRYFR